MRLRLLRLPPLLRQWGVLLTLLAAGVVATGWSGWFWREDLLMYDAGLSYGPPPADILIVAIDDASLAQLGRWPWRRDTHAALLDRLRTAGVAAVALDVVFTEPETANPDDDARLAAAMRRGPPTILPLIVDWPRAGGSLRESLPIPALAAAAAGLAHAHLELDRDGIARSVYLREGLASPNHPHLALALLEVLPGAQARGLPGERGQEATPRADLWVRDYHILIPFLGPPGHFNHVSYVDVLRGVVPDSDLRGKLVLVGATAQGLGDAYPTPRSGEGVAMSGVEITANVLHALRARHTIQAASRVTAIVLSLIPLCAAFLGFLRLSPRGSLMLILALFVGTLAFSLLALRYLYWWWPPATALTALMVAYPLWSWRRLEATQAYLDEELSRLDQEQLPLAPVAAVRSTPPRRFDLLQGRIDSVRAATARLRHLRSVLSDTVASLPDAMLLVDRDGKIVLANTQAATLFGAPNAAALEGQSIDSHIGDLLAARDSSYSILADHAPASIELQDASGRELMLRVAAVRDAHDLRTGCVLDIADVSDLKSAERERDDLIRFLSHDLRSPSTSLLALAEIMRDPARAPATPEAARRVESLARRTLALADGFIALARAHVLEPARFDELDLRDALQDALDEVWAAGEARGVKVRLCLPEGPLMLWGDRQMLGRAFANLLSNATKYAPEGSCIDVAVEWRERRWVLSVHDTGPGIAPEQQSGLFQRFHRIIPAQGQDPGGVGLGLAFVRVVARKHRGDVGLVSESGRGATFTVLLPGHGD